MSATTKTKSPAKPAKAKLSEVIRELASEFRLKPGQRGFDAVGELIKARRRA